MTLPLVFNRYRADIHKGLTRAMSGHELPLYGMMRYHLGWTDVDGKASANSTGKALRPTLCLLACESLGGEYHKALPAAVAVELVHNFSLIHDDIQDDDVERRHRPTVWSVWGKAQAINAGTGMRILASLSLNAFDGQVPVTRRVKIQNLIDESCLALIEGQYLDISYENRLDVGVEAYLSMVSKKTAALIACALETGGLVAIEDDKVIGGFGEAGRSLGLAFQIRDDILGIWGDARQTGKSAGNDIRRRKKSLPVVYALENAAGASKERLYRFYSNGASCNDEAVSSVLQIMESISARRRAQELAEKYRDEALAKLAALPLNSAGRCEFEELVHFLVEREF